MPAVTCGGVTMRKTMLLSAALVLIIATVTHAVPVPTAERVNIPERPGSPTQDICTLVYYNYCYRAM